LLTPETKKSQTMTRIIHATTKAHDQSARQLFIQYADTLGLDLEFQGFSRELAGLPGECASPGGCILLAEVVGGYAGCAALRPLQDKTCEMKRLYAIPEHQGHGIGRVLAGSVIGEARNNGYQKMRLDTVESMKE
jgi:GNAT superfamily N-acetyltransferase